jgi:hypothetical protein
MRRLLAICAAAAFILSCADYSRERQEGTSDSGVTKAEVVVETDPTTGMTVEQENVGQRLTADNTIGSIKHLYVISAYSGQVILYSTVRGKVTSSSKRLTPTQVAAADGQYVDQDLRGMRVRIGDNWYRTPEVLQDDGTYGSSIPYLFWWDEQGRYHQHYVSGGQILHVSDQPIRVPEIRIHLSAE